MSDNKKALVMVAIFILACSVESILTMVGV